MDMNLAATVTSPQGALLSPTEREQATEQLLKSADKHHTKPLWAQMARLNPPLPNPKCEVHVWDYDQIRPALLQAGELVTEKQAERRVLMLVNPKRGTIKSLSSLYDEVSHVIQRLLLRLTRYTPACSW